MIESFNQYLERKSRVPVEYYKVNGRLDLLTNLALGLSIEASELADPIMRAKFRGYDLDEQNIREEIGDIMWYVGGIIEHMGFDFNDILDTNLVKGKIRYPNGYTPKASQNRDIDMEKQVLFREP